MVAGISILLIVFQVQTDIFFWNNNIVSQEDLNFIERYLIFHLMSPTLNATNFHNPYLFFGHFLLRLQEPFLALRLF